MDKKENKAPENEELKEEAAEEKAPEKTELETANEKISELNDKYLRLYAEYDNFRKRTLREKDARYGDAVIDAAAAILPIGDNLERALASEVTSEDAKKLKDGVEMVMKQFSETLEKLEVKPIKALGEKFDPNLHNAVMHIEDETIDDNTVVEEFMKGYEYKDGRVVRYSMVKVAN
ncbi:MAG: nucleotide exchange factor GrpE [bacterium]|nr:nucleotide exchange factor GrpE [bacterium]